MTDAVAKCGCNCFNCPTYRDNINSLENRSRCSAGWEKYLNIKLSPEKLRACDGCSIADSARNVYYLNCKIRKCAIINNLDNCAFCSEFPCDELLEVHSVQKITNRTEFVKRTGKEISEYDYKLFIEPYTGLKHLREIRKTLSTKDYKEYKKFSPKIKFSQFDVDSPRQECLKTIYSILTTIGIEYDISFARLQTLKYKREQLVKILWVLGCYGKYIKNHRYVELDGKTFLSHKMRGMYKQLIEYFDELKQYDIYCEIIPMVKKGWLTPMGGLRKDGWKVRFEFRNKSNEIDTLTTFMEYIQKLVQRYGQNAFKRFNKADLSILTS